jgi:adenylate cyclase
LGARYLLAGSVRKSPSELRVSVQLIDGPTGRQIWAQRYDRRLADIFEVQDDIVEAIAATVAPKLARAEVQRSTVRSRQDLDVWDLCLRGMACIQEMSLDGNARARDLFEEAVTIRQDYADAYSGVAMSHNQDALFADSRDRRAHAELALAVAQKAVALDGASALAHRELSTTYQLLDRRDDAMAEARLAVELNPHDAFALHSLGNMLDLAGHAEGIALMEKAQRLNPEDTQAYTHPTYLARAYFNAGNMDQAVERARKAVRRNPDYAPAYYIMALALAQLGHDDDAARMLAVCDALQPGFLESRETWQPYADAARNEKLREALLSVQALRRR